MIRKGILSRHRRELLLGRARGDETNSTFVANDYTPALDTPDTLTFTLKDANNVVIPGADVVYA